MDNNHILKNALLATQRKGASGVAAAVVVPGLLNIHSKAGAAKMKKSKKYWRNDGKKDGKKDGKTRHAGKGNDRDDSLSSGVVRARVRAYAACASVCASVPGWAEWGDAKVGEGVRKCSGGSVPGGRF